MKVTTFFSILKPIYFVVLFFFYFLIFTPLGLLLRAIGKDYLKIKFSKKINSYWIQRKKKLISMNKQS